MFRTLVPLIAALAVAAPTRAGEDKFVKLALADGRVLSVAENSDEAGAQVVAAKDGDSRAQQWRVVEDGPSLKLVNRKSGMVLDVFEDSKDEDVKIIIWEEKTEDNDNQRWQWDGTGKARRLKSKSSALVLDVDGQGGVVQKKADDKAKGQLWTVKELK
jgi:Ricin-type beta-trefoil lectin domain-like